MGYLNQQTMERFGWDPSQWIQGLPTEGLDYGMGSQLVNTYSTTNYFSEFKVSNVVIEKVYYRVKERALNELCALFDTFIAMKSLRTVNITTFDNVQIRNTNFEYSVGYIQLSGQYININNLVVENAGSLDFFAEHP
jgi:hypothetical protein